MIFLRIILSSISTPWDIDSSVRKDGPQIVADTPFREKGPMQKENVHLLRDCLYWRPRIFKGSVSVTLDPEAWRLGE